VVDARNSYNFCRFVDHRFQFVLDFIVIFINSCSPNFEYRADLVDLGVR